jgi:hypothetical protein
MIILQLKFLSICSISWTYSWTIWSYLILCFLLKIYFRTQWSNIRFWFYCIICILTLSSELRNCLWLICLRLWIILFCYILSYILFIFFWKLTLSCINILLQHLILWSLIIYIKLSIWIINVSLIYLLLRLTIIWYS